MTSSYVLDSNVIILLNREQPRDIYPSVWMALEELIDEGRAVIPREVLEELRRVDDECEPWAKSQDDFIKEPTQAELLVVRDITDAHPAWVRDQANAADPFLVAYAVEQSVVIVTNERRKGPGTEDRNLRIPNVADEWDVECIDFKTLARAEGWRF